MLRWGAFRSTPPRVRVPAASRLRTYLPAAAAGIQPDLHLSGHAHLYELNRVFEKLMKRGSEIKTAIVP